MSLLDRCPQLPPGLPHHRPPSAYPECRRTSPTPRVPNAIETSSPAIPQPLDLATQTGGSASLKSEHWEKSKNVSAQWCAPHPSPNPRRGHVKPVEGPHPVAQRPPRSRAQRIQPHLPPVVLAKTPVPHVERMGSGAQHPPFKLRETTED